MPKQQFYAVRNGRKPGIYSDWNTTRAQVTGFSGSQYKGFTSRAEAEAYLGGEKSLSSLRSSPGTPYTKRDTVPKLQERHFHRSSATTKLSQETSDNTSKNVHIVYCDGSSLSNGQKGARAGWGVWWGDDNPNNLFGALKGDEQTNNRGELQAIREAVLQMKNMESGTYIIRTDSEYAMKCLTIWGDNWEANGWQRKGGPVLNLDLIKEGRAEIREAKQAGIDVKLEYVRGHNDDYGNEMADSLARQGANSTV